MSADRIVFVRDLVLPARIGVLDFEHDGPQRVRVDVTFTVADPGGVGADTLDRVVDYGRVADQARAVVAAGHVRLAETLAERIAEAVLTEPRIKTVTVRVEKLDILGDGAIAGVEISRGR